MYALTLTELQLDTLLGTLRQYSWLQQSQLSVAYQPDYVKLLQEDIKNTKDLISVVETAVEQSPEASNMKGNSEARV